MTDTLVAPPEAMNRAAVVDTVIALTTSLLKASATEVEIVESTSLLDLKGFDSLFVANLLERVEDQVGAQMDPALMLPETFATPGALADAMIKSFKL